MGGGVRIAQSGAAAEAGADEIANGERFVGFGAGPVLGGLASDLDPILDGEKNGGICIRGVGGIDGQNTCRHNEQGGNPLWYHFFIPVSGTLPMLISARSTVESHFKGVRGAECTRGGKYSSLIGCDQFWR